MFLDIILRKCVRVKLNDPIKYSDQKANNEHFGKHDYKFWTRNNRTTEKNLQLFHVLLIPEDDNASNL